MQKLVRLYARALDLPTEYFDGIGREFSLEGMLDSFTQRKNVTVNLNTQRRQ